MVEQVRLQRVQLARRFRSGKRLERNERRGVEDAEAGGRREIPLLWRRPGAVDL